MKNELNSLKTLIFAKKCIKDAIVKSWLKFNAKRSVLALL